MITKEFVTTHHEELRKLSGQLHTLTIGRTVYTIKDPVRLHNTIPAEVTTKRRFRRRTTLPPALTGSNAHRISHMAAYMAGDVAKRLSTAERRLTSEDMRSVTTHVTSAFYILPDERDVTICEYRMEGVLEHHTAVCQTVVICNSKSNSTELVLLDILDNVVVHIQREVGSLDKTEEAAPESLSPFYPTVAYIRAGYFGPDALSVKILELKDAYKDDPHYAEICAYLEKIKHTGNEAYARNQAEKATPPVSQTSDEDEVVGIDYFQGVRQLLQTVTA